MTMLTSDEAPLGDISSNVATTQWIADSGYITNVVSTPLTMGAGYVDTNVVTYYFTESDEYVNSGNSVDITIPFGISTVIFDTTACSNVSGQNIYLNLTLTGPSVPLPNPSVFYMTILCYCNNKSAVIWGGDSIYTQDTYGNVTISGPVDPIVDISLNHSGCVRLAWLQQYETWQIANF